MDIAQWLREIAGQLINGTIKDGDIEVAKLVEAANEIERLRSEVDNWHTIYLEEGENS